MADLCDTGDDKLGSRNHIGLLKPESRLSCTASTLSIGGVRLPVPPRRTLISGLSPVSATQLYYQLQMVPLHIVSLPLLQLSNQGG